jgi:hypothetical protein
VSFLLQYRRIFAGSETLKKICLLFLVFVAVWAVVQCLLISFACIPLAMFVPSMADKCLPALTLWYISAAVNILTDFVILLVPLRSVYHLKLRTQKKIFLVSIFCLGFL